ncbi:hypothetical protein CsatB_011733 [Cannabis sativa]
MKLDMSKAYDRVEWVFVERMLLKLGFEQQWVDKLMKCVYSVRYSFQLNGQIYGEVIPTRGLRQGDPLSPYLFLICAEGFSALIRHAEEKRDILGLKIARHAPPISHLFFADDSLLMFKASERTLVSIQKNFSLYAACSGQMINYTKSLLLFSPNTPEGIRVQYVSSLAMTMTEEIETYLGLPMVVGRNKKTIFRPIKDKIWSKLNSWHTKLFSQAGKEILLKAVVQSMPMYYMSCFIIPEGTCEEIEKLMARYWWGSFQSKRKIHWRAWQKLCFSKRKGGLGFRRFVQYNQALLAKQAWRVLINPTSILAQVLKARYFPQQSFLEATESSHPSQIWRGIVWGKELLIKGLRRRIGNGANTRVFKDPWIPRPPSFLPITKEVGDLMMVSELIEQSGQWNIDLIHQVFSTPDSQLILSIPITMYEHDDDWLWHFTSHGHYSVKSGYNLAIGGENLQPSSSNEVMAAWWSSYWAIKIPKKILHFGWKGFHEILPSFSGLFRRQSSSHSNCPICGFGNDTNAHAIFWCSFSQVIWKEMSFPFLASPKEDMTFKGVLLYASEILEKEDFEKVLISAWTIWFERNKKSHGRTIRTPHQIKIWISSYYNEICRERNKTKKGVSTGCTSEQSNTETEVNNYKLYVDAAISTPQNVIGFGAVIFSSDKQMKAALSKPLQGSFSVFQAEAVALLVGLRWAQDVGLPVEKVFSDSLSLVSALEGQTVYLNELGVIFSDIKVLLSSFPGASLSHVSRNFNVEAHRLAKHALRIDNELSWMEEIPPPSV